jgi:hypothetical protein
MIRRVYVSLVIVGCCAWSTARAEEAIAPGTKCLTQRQREQIAIRAVKQVVGPWIPKGDQIRVRSAIVPFNGDERNPITGRGPVEVFVRQDPKQGTRHGPLGAFFDKFSNRRFYVNVCRNGQSCVLAMESDAPFYKIGRALRPVGEVAKDVLTSKDVLGGVIQMGLGIAASGSMREVAVAAGTSGLAFVVNAVKGRNDARKRALTDTVTWAREAGNGPTGYPHVTTAYRHYQERLQDIKAGTTSVSLKQFAEQLSAQGL